MHNLIGLKYPIEDESGKIVGYRKITKVLDLDNVAGYVVGLSNREPSILISYGLASDLSKNQNLINDLPIFE